MDGKIDMSTWCYDCANSLKTMKNTALKQNIYNNEIHENKVLWTQKHKTESKENMFLNLFTCTHAYRWRKYKCETYLFCFQVNTN